MPILVPPADFGAIRLGRLCHDRRKRLRRGRQVVRIREFHDAASEHLRGGVAAHPLQRGAGVEERALGVDHDDEVGCILDHRAEAPVAIRKCVLREFALAYKRLLAQCGKRFLLPPEHERAETGKYGEDRDGE